MHEIEHGSHSKIIEVIDDRIVSMMSRFQNIFTWSIGFHNNGAVQYWFMNNFGMNQGSIH